MELFFQQQGHLFLGFHGGVIRFVSFTFHVPRDLRFIVHRLVTHRAIEFAAGKAIIGEVTTWSFAGRWQVANRAWAVVIVVVVVSR